MFKFASLLAFVTLASSVAAQAPIYGQCGGQGWSGATTCAAGSVCTYSNDYYSQCLPGSASSTTAPTSTVSVPTSTASGTSSAPSSTSTAAAGNPFEGYEIFASPYYAAEVAAAAANITDSTLAGKAASVANIPTFTWFDQVAKVPTLGTYLANATALQTSSGNKQIVPIVVYDLPDRDCAASASNGEFSIADNGEANYKDYIDQLVAQIKQYPDVRVVAVIEPDSLANLVTNLSVEKCANAQTTYLACVNYAIEQLATVNVYMYLDAGHAGWLGWPANLSPAATLFTQVYQNAGSSPFVRGLATNVANYNALVASSPDPITQGNPNYDESLYINARAIALLSRGLVPRIQPARSRGLYTSVVVHNVPTWPPPPMPQAPVGPSSNLGAESPPTKQQRESFWKQWSSSASFQAALTTVVGLGMVFAAGVGYLEWYKAHVLHRIERAFAPGYDPALEVSTLLGTDASHIRRAEQPLIDSIVRGEQAGGYYLMVGPKGTGKGTMIVDSMRKINAEGAAFCEAHPDLEVFRLRLGKALDFDFYEDWQGSLFSRADPRQGGPGLDVERVMSKLEKVALRYARKHGRPLVVAFNNVHLFPNSPEGHAILHQLQQRAEAWAEGGLMTMIFSTDDFWPLDIMRKNASRMRIVSVYDLPRHESLNALRRLREQSLKRQYPAQEIEVEGDEILGKVYDIVGGRTSYLSRVARAPNMIEEAEGMIEWERNWLTSKIGLIPEHDDDVMDEQKWASCSWLLLRHLAKMAPTLPGVGRDEPDHEDGSGQVSHGAVDEDASLPKVTFEEARRIMTRTDFVQDLDHLHIISIDVHHHVRIDSMLLLRAAQQVINEEGFDEALDVTRDRIDQIEGLHRQSELTVKEPFKITLGEEAGKTVLEVVGLGESFVSAEVEDKEASEDRLV